MKTNLTFREKWFIFWGFGYYVNYRSKEIHRVSEKHSNCHLHMISKGEFVTKARAIELIRKHHFNGCRWCFKGEDRG